MSPSPEPTVRIVGRDAFDGLRDAWTALWTRLPNATPFNSWEWCAAWLATLGGDVDARFVLMESGSELRGVLPLVNARAVRMPLVPLRTLRFCAVDSVHPDQLEPVVMPEDLPRFFELALDALWHARGPSSVNLPMVAEDSPTFAALKSLKGSRVSTRAVSVAPYLPVKGTFEEFLGTLSSNERYKIRSRSKKLLTGKGVEYGPVPNLTKVAALAHLRDLHSRRAEQKGIESTFDTGAVQAFHEKLLAIFPADRVVFRSLHKDGEIFAMFYGFVTGNRMFYFQLGYDPKWSDSSPGLVLLSQTIRETFEMGLGEYNFLQGNEPFKSTWTKAVRELHDWTIYAPSLHGRLVRELDVRGRAALRRLRGDDAQGRLAHG